MNADQYNDPRGDGSFGQFEAISVHNPTLGTEYKATVHYTSCTTEKGSVSYNLAISGKDAQGATVIFEYHIGSVSGGLTGGCEDDEWTFVMPTEQDAGTDEATAEAEA